MSVEVPSGQQQREKRRMAAMMEVSGGGWGVYIGSVAVLCLPVLLLLRYGSNRLIRMRGKQNGALAGAACAFMFAWALTQVARMLFVECGTFGLLGVATTWLLWDRLFAYMFKFHFLFKKTEMGSKGLQQQQEGQNDAMEDQAGIALQVYLRSISNYGKFVRTVNFLMLVGSIVIYAMEDVDYIDGQHVNESWYIKVSNLSGMVVILGMIPQFISICKHSFQSDPLKLRGSLLRLSLFGILLAIVELVLGVIVVKPRLLGISILVLVFLIYVDVVIISVIRAIKDERVSSQVLEGRNMDGRLLALQEYIHTEEGKKAMHDHLNAELSLEVLNFILEVSKFIKDFAELKEKTSQDEEVPVSPPKRKVQSAVLPKAKKQGTDDTGTASDIKMLSKLKNANNGIIKSLSPAAWRSQNRDLMRGEMEDRCHAIYLRFIDKQAKEQVNLPDGKVKKFEPLEKLLRPGTNSFSSRRKFSVDLSERRPVGGHAKVKPDIKFDVDPDVFNEVLHEILNMLYYDSFRRFLTKPENKAAWEKFISEREQIKMYE